MSNPLDYLSNIGSMVSGVASLFKNHSREQYNYQRLLNAQQQQYARENREAELFNQYQYQFNLPSLNKAALQAAGLSVSGLENGHVSSVSTPNTAAPSSGAAPTGVGDIQAQLGVANLLQNVKLLDAQARKTNADAIATEIQNDINSSSSDWDKLLRQSQAISNSVNALNSLKFGERKAQAETITAEIETQLKNFEFTDGTKLTLKQIETAEQTLNVLSENLTNLKKQGVILDKTSEKISQEIEESRARVRNINASTLKTKAETKGINLQNNYTESTLQDRINITQNQRVRSLLDSYPKTLREASYALILNPELYPIITRNMSEKELQELQNINKKLLDFNDISSLLSPWK